MVQLRRCVDLLEEPIHKACLHTECTDGDDAIQSFAEGCEDGTGRGRLYAADVTPGRLIHHCSAKVEKGEDCCWNEERGKYRAGCYVVQNERDSPCYEIPDMTHTMVNTATRSATTDWVACCKVWERDASMVSMSCQEMSMCITAGTLCEENLTLLNRLRMRP